jgi:quercetin dioxygenase-like cupin family protein
MRVNNKFTVDGKYFTDNQRSTKRTGKTARHLLLGAGILRHIHQAVFSLQVFPAPNQRPRSAPETNGVTVTLLKTFDLGPEIEGMAGRQFRMRMVTIEAGGVIGPIHDHKDRPGMVYILQGTITDHRDGAATDYGPGVGWPEDKDTIHWLENRGTTPAVEISVDLVRSS